MKKLSICVTRYKEPWEVCKDLFDSIQTQRGINFEDIEVIVVNDGRDELLTGREFINYPFHVDYIPMEEHGGVSKARNFARDKATGEYVMFCDIDDMFLNNCALHLIFGAIKEKPDVIISSFIEEAYSGDTYKIIRHDKDATFIHGKVFNRDYLNENNIRFKDELTIHEDGYFVLTSLVCTEEKREISTPIYMWKWNDNSVVRKDAEDYVLKTYDHLMNCRWAICKELEERGFIDKYFDSVVKTVVDSYYDFNKPGYLDPKNKALVAKAEKAFKKFYTEFGKDYKESNINRIAEMMFVCRQNAFKNGLRVEQRTINEWLNHITKEV